MTFGSPVDRGPAAVREALARLERATSSAERVQALGRLAALGKWLTPAARQRVDAEFARLLGASQSGENPSAHANTFYGELTVQIGRPPPVPIARAAAPASASGARPTPSPGTTRGRRQRADGPRPIPARALLGARFPPRSCGRSSLIGRDLSHWIRADRPRPRLTSAVYTKG